MFNRKTTGLVTPTNPAFLAYAKDYDLIGKPLLRWSPYLGSYGMGGPGFVGFQLDDAGTTLVCTLWGAACWIEIDGRIIDAGSSQESEWNALVNGFVHGTPDLVKDLYIEMKPVITEVDFQRTSCSITAQDESNRHFVIAIDQESMKRPVFAGGGALREFTSQDDLRESWIITKSPMINI